MRSAWHLWLVPLLLASLACGIVVQSTTVVHEDESSATELTVAMEKALLSEPSVASRWQALIAKMTAGLDERGAVVEPYDDGRLNGMQASLSFPDLESASAALTGDELSLFDTFELKRWRGEVIFEAHTTSALIRRRIQQITGMSETDLLLVQFPLRLSLKLPGTLLYSNAGQTEPGGVQTWAINWLVDGEHTLRASSQIPLIPPAITEPAPGTRIRDASAGVDFAGTGEPGADLILYRVEGDSRTELARGEVNIDRTWRLQDVRLGSVGEYTFLVEESTDSDIAIGQPSTAVYRPLQPIVFVPGFYACSQGLTGDSVVWRTILNVKRQTDPKGTGLFPAAVAVYQPLFDMLESLGYQRGRDYFVACYDWSESLPEEAEDFSRTLQSALESNPARLPVTVITHSNGGLVARYYIQRRLRENQGEINSLIMIAPPNQGVVRSYYGWEGGTFAREAPDVQLLLRYTLQRKCRILPPARSTRARGRVMTNPNYATELTEYHEKVYRCLRNGNETLALGTRSKDEDIPSVAWLLPGFPFLKREGSEVARYPDAPINALNTCAEQSTLLRRVQGNLTILAGRIEDSTEKHIGVTSASGQSPLWEQGLPVGPAEMADGDDTVLWESVQLPRTDPMDSAPCDAIVPPVEFAGAHHADCPSLFENAEVLWRIAELIGEDAGGAIERPACQQGDQIIAWLASPANLLMTDPQGRRVGVDASGNLVGEIPDAAYGDTADPLGPKFIVIPDPAEGEYQFQVTGLAEGHYELYGLSSASDEPLIAVSDSITPGEVKTHTAEHSAAPLATRPASRRWILWALVGVVGLGGVGWVAARRGRRRQFTEYDPWADSCDDPIAEPPRRKPWRRRRKKDDFPSDDW